ncbi:MAG: hypothetical protein IJW21_05230 [Clostridia bacterium]|nr:hypothetical protein [Clostridia bacterium]
MTREDAYFERVLLLAGFWDGYDEWLDGYLEREEPLSDIVLELVDCRGDMKEVEYRLNLYCLEKPFDEESVHERLRLFLWDGYKSEKMSKDEVLAAMGKFSRILPDGGAFGRNCEILYYDYDLVEGGVISEEQFDGEFLAFLESGKSVDWEKVYRK